MEKEKIEQHMKTVESAIELLQGIIVKDPEMNRQLYLDNGMINELHPVCVISSAINLLENDVPKAFSRLEKGDW